MVNKMTVEDRVEYEAWLGTVAQYGSYEEGYMRVASETTELGEVELFSDEVAAWMAADDTAPRAAGEGAACTSDADCGCPDCVRFSFELPLSWCGKEGHDEDCDCDLDSVPF